MTRVLMTADAVGGVWTFALDLAASLTARGHEVHLATMGPRPDETQRGAASAAGVGLYESDFALEWMPGRWSDVDEAGDWLLALAHEVQPDVVHLNGYAHAVLPWPAPVVVVGHSCVLSWWDAVHGEPAPPEWDDYRDRVSAGLAAADAVVAPTAAMLAELQRWYGVRTGIVVPNSRTGSAAPTGDRAPLLFAAGRVWDEAKNLDRLAAVADRLPWPVAIAGDATAPGDRDGDLVTGAMVTLLGRLPWAELRRWLARASVFVAPASYEPFGLGPLEAAQAGCALVLGDIPSLREVWRDAAVYVPPRDDDALVATLCRLAAEPDERAALADRARARARAFPPARTADGYERIYDRLVGDRATPRPLLGVSA